MPLSRFNNARDANEPSIVSGLRRIGATVEKLDKPVDLLVGFRGVNYLLEVKGELGPKGGSTGRNLTPDQETFFATWRGQRCVVRNISDALQAIGAHRQGCVESRIQGPDCTERGVRP